MIIALPWQTWARKCPSDSFGQDVGIYSRCTYSLRILEGSFHDFASHDLSRTALYGFKFQQVFYIQLQISITSEAVFILKIWIWPGWQVQTAQWLRYPTPPPQTRCLWTLQQTSFEFATGSSASRLQDHSSLLRLPASCVLTFCVVLCVSISRCIHRWKLQYDNCSSVTDMSEKVPQWFFWSRCWHLFKVHIFLEDPWGLFSRFCESWLVTDCIVWF